jgi:glycosyltransferase involved in cell wall biosynthesis
MPLDRDTRAKKFAATLSRGGYEVILLSPVSREEDTSDQRMGAVRIVPVVVGSRHRDTANQRASSVRRARPLVITREIPESYVTRVAERRGQLRRNNELLAELRTMSGERTPDGVAAAARWAALRARRSLIKAVLQGTRVRWLAQHQLNKAVAKSWKVVDGYRLSSGRLATTRGVLPEILDYAEAFAPALDALEPDIIHAHHPVILHTALRAARRRRARGFACQVVYDARENFAGIPAGEQGSPRRHAVLVRQESETIREFDRVVTVSDPIAEELYQRYSLDTRPAVVLNVPVRGELTNAPTVRESIGLDDGTPLLLYSGGISRARGLETLVEAMGLLPDHHLAIVAVPFPHPSVPALVELAESVGAGHRVHVTAPVPQRDIPRFLSGADIAVHPMPGGSPNHDQAMPNKLFEYLHAGLPLVVSDARVMAEFVTSGSVGEVFTSGDAPSLADAVRRVRSEPPSAEHLSEVASRYSWQGEEQTILRLYDGLSGWKSAQPADDHIDLDVVPTTLMEESV